MTLAALNEYDEATPTWKEHVREANTEHRCRPDLSHKNKQWIPVDSSVEEAYPGHQS
jgi:hypothetical protein